MNCISIKLQLVLVVVVVAAVVVYDQVSYLCFNVHDGDQ